MAVSADQYQQLLTRLTRIENVINDIIVAQENFITLSQLNQLNTIITTQIDDLTTTVESLENRVEDIEAEPLL